MTVVQRVEALAVIALALAGLLGGAAAASGLIPVAPPEAAALVLSIMGAVKIVSTGGALVAYLSRPLSGRGL